MERFALEAWLGVRVVEEVRELSLDLDVLGVAVLAVAGLGYMYYQNRQDTIVIKLPAVTIEKK